MNSARPDKFTSMRFCGLLESAVRKILLILTGCLLTGLLLSARADSFTLTDGSVMAGDIVRSDDNGLMLRAPGDVYTNVLWSQFSQDSLKQLAQDPKYSGLVQPFIDPTATSHPAPAPLKLQEVSRLEMPPKTSVVGGLFSSSVGLFIVFVIYLANLYAGYEIAKCRRRPIMGVVIISAVLPFIGPVAFLLMPPLSDAVPEEEQPEEAVAPVQAPFQVPSQAAAPQAASAAQTAAPAVPAKEQAKADMSITVGGWTQSGEQAKKPEPVIFPRGKFTFNKRFIETKFPTFIKGTNTDMVLLVTTAKDKFTATRIAQLGMGDMQLASAEGEFTVAFSDIQEIQLKPLDA